MPGLINGVASEIIVDSGAGNLVLSSSFAAQLGLNASGDVIGGGVTGLSLGSIVQAPSVSLGNITLHPQIANVFDLDALSAIAGRPIMAVIGRDLFDQFVVEIDFARNRIAFRRANSEPAHNVGRQLPLVRESNGNRALPIAVEGKPPIQAMFDLGSDTALYLSADYAKRHDLLKGKRQSTSMSAGVEGTKLNRIAMLNDIEIGGSMIRDVPIEVPQHGPARLQRLSDCPFCSGFRLVIDFAHNRISLSPIEAAMQTPFRKDRSGVGAGRVGNGLRIIYVAPGSLLPL